MAVKLHVASAWFEIKPTPPRFSLVCPGKCWRKTPIVPEPLPVIFVANKQSASFDTMCLPLMIAPLVDRQEMLSVTFHSRLSSAVPLPLLRVLPRRKVTVSTVSAKPVGRVNR